MVPVLLELSLCMGEKDLRLIAAHISTKLRHLTNAKREKMRYCDGT